MKKSLIKDKNEFRKKVELLKNIPTLPHLMIKFTQMANDPHTSFAAFGDEVSKDQTLTSKLLKLVNSAFYGFPGKIGTVTQALVLLGIDALKGLIVTSSVFDGLTPEAYPLWRHSMLVSLLCRHICSALNIQDVEEIAVAGLLHDIGKVILFLEAPEEYRLVIKEALETEKPVWKAEQELLGFDHTEIGQWLCEKWTLPKKLAIPIQFHHEPGKEKNFQIRTHVVALADAIIKGIGCSAEKGIILEDLNPLTLKELKNANFHLFDFIEKIEPEMEALENIGPGDLK